MQNQKDENEQPKPPVKKETSTDPIPRGGTEPRVNTEFDEGDCPNHE